jgi:hypothetical protein
MTTYLPTLKQIQYLVALHERRPSPAGGGLRPQHRPRLAQEQPRGDEFRLLAEELRAGSGSEGVSAP